MANINKITALNLARKLHPELTDERDATFLRYTDTRFGLLFRLPEDTKYHELILSGDKGLDYLDETWWLDENGKPHIQGKWVTMSEEEQRELGFLTGRADNGEAGTAE